MKTYKLLICATDINFTYGYPSDYWHEYYSEFYKTNQLRFKAEFVLCYLEGGDVSVSYESIDDRIYNEGAEKRLRPYWSYHIYFVSCRGVAN